MILTYFGVKRNLNHTQELNGPEPTCQFLWVIAKKHFHSGQLASTERIAKSGRDFRIGKHNQHPQAGEQLVLAAGHQSHPAAKYPSD